MVFDSSCLYLVFGSWLVCRDVTCVYLLIHRAVAVKPLRRVISELDTGPLEPNEKVKSSSEVTKSQQQTADNSRQQQ